MDPRTKFLVTLYACFLFIIGALTLIALLYWLTAVGML